MKLENRRYWYGWTAIVVLFIAIYCLSPIMAPFVFGALIAYIGDPVVDRLEAFKFSRGLSVALVFTFLIVFLVLFIVLLFPLLNNQLEDIFEKAPKYGNWLDQTLSQLTALVGVDVKSLNFQELAKEYIPQAGGVTKNLLTAVFQSGSALVSSIIFMMLTPIIAFYLMRDWDIMVDRIHDLIPHSIRGMVSELAKDSDRMVSAFLRGQFLVMSGLGIIYAAGLSIIGLQSALLVGFIAGLLSFIPYLGTAVGVVLASILFIVQYQDWMSLWQIGLVFFIGQSIEGYVLTPWLVGDRIGLHPLAVIFAVLAGGQLFGFTGVLLALPVSAILAVLIRYGVARYKESDVYNEPEKKTNSSNAATSSD